MSCDILNPTNAVYFPGVKLYSPVPQIIAVWLKDRPTN